MARTTISRQSRRRWKAPLAALAVGLVTTTGATPLLGAAPRADAIPIPICTPDDPCPSEDPKPFDWDANVTLLDEGSVEVNPILDAQWLGLAIPPFIGGGGGVIWSNADKDEGHLHTSTKPNTTRVSFNMSEAGQPGSICRINNSWGMPASNQTLRILAAPRSGKLADELSMLASKVKGTFNVDTAEVRVDSTSLVARDDGLFVTVTGHVWNDNLVFPNVDADFTYKVLLHPHPSGNPLDPHAVVSIGFDHGDLKLVGSNPLDKVLLAFADDVEPKFGIAVSGRATTAFNDAIGAENDVSWFTSLGYSFSARRVITSQTGVDIDGAFCRLGS